ncbi:MAG: hypothetical protein AB7V42_12260 [Thermoleophilia bacterium]
MSDPLLRELRDADPARRRPDDLAEAGRDEALLASILTVAPVAKGSTRSGRRRLVVVVAATVVATVAASAIAVTTISLTSNPPTQPTRLTQSADSIGIDRALIGGLVLGSDAQLRVPVADGAWEVAVSHDGGDTLWVKPPSQAGADGIACPVPADTPPIWACLQGTAPAAFVAGRTSVEVAQVVVHDAGTVAAVPLAEGVFLLPAPPFPTRLEALSADGNLLSELTISNN